LTVLCQGYNPQSPVLALESGAFKWPPISDGVMQLTSAQLAALVDGMDWSRLHARNIAQPTATS